MVEPELTVTGKLPFRKISALSKPILRFWISRICCKVFLWLYSAGSGGSYLFGDIIRPPGPSTEPVNIQSQTHTPPIRGAYESVLDWELPGFDGLPQCPTNETVRIYPAAVVFRRNVILETTLWSIGQVALQLT